MNPYPTPTEEYVTDLGRWEQYKLLSRRTRDGLREGWQKRGHLLSISPIKAQHDRREWLIDELWMCAFETLTEAHEENDRWNGWGEELADIWANVQYMRKK